jgi:hypothetical protein
MLTRLSRRDRLLTFDIDTVPSDQSGSLVRLIAEVLPKASKETICLYDFGPETHAITAPGLTKGGTARELKRDRFRRIDRSVLLAAHKDGFRSSDIPTTPSNRLSFLSCRCVAWCKGGGNCRSRTSAIRQANELWTADVVDRLPIYHHISL